MIHVMKRDGEIADFDLSKITEAIRKAFIATGKDFTPEILDLLALRVTSDFQKHMDGDTIEVEQIQDSVERVLEQTNYTDVAKAYILYRKQREKIRNLGTTGLDYKDVVNNYVNISDWRVKENSTVTYSVGGLILNNSGAVTANYWLSEIYDADISEAHRNADIHIHDLSMLTGYCCGWSLKQLIMEGLGGVTGKITSAPAKHLSSLCNQMVNFLGIMQNEWAAAQSFSSFDTYLAPFVKSDGLSYEKVKKCIESFIYGVNTPSRWGTQAPFSNITLDWTVPDDLKNVPAIIGGKAADFTYGDCAAEMSMINRAFLETMLEGDSNGLGFQYPIPTYPIAAQFDWSDSLNNELLFKLSCKYGTPYFLNFRGNGRNPEDIRHPFGGEAPDLHKLYNKSGGFFGFGEQTGSIGVVTINLPRLAYESENESGFFEGLDRMMDICAKSLDIKRSVITNLLKSGLYPYTEQYLENFDRHFSTIGLIGMNEAALNAKWLQKDLSSPEAQNFANAVLNHMRNRLVVYQLQYHCLFSLEASPAESATYRLARADKELYPDIITAGKAGDIPYYTNSSQLAADYTDDVWEALRLQDNLQSLYTSGTVFQIFLDGETRDWKTVRDMVQKITDQYHLPCLTISPTYSICPTHGFIPGGKELCPACHSQVQVYSSIVGYYRPIEDWNEGKAQEYRNRKPYRI